MLHSVIEQHGANVRVSAQHLRRQASAVRSRRDDGGRVCQAVRQHAGLVSTMVAAGQDERHQTVLLPAAPRQEVHHRRLAIAAPGEVPDADDRHRQAHLCPHACLIQPRACGSRSCDHGADGLKQWEQQQAPVQVLLRYLRRAEGDVLKLPSRRVAQSGPQRFAGHLRRGGVPVTAATSARALVRSDGQGSRSRMATRCSPR
mmetsp:Transcript_39849/g.101079  ORF Transcript_39849/g.101079 Transcript_39849/m.101079 type:complete len:202 (+) Transcript_39849:529-1134(+)